jgi:murein DD-endopeptidase MepM/ murein hydrolase activator NlpD
VLLLAACGGDPDVHAPGAPRERPPEEPAPPEAPPVVAMDEDVLRRGEGLEAPLDRLGIDANEREALVAALDGVAEVRRLAAGTGVGTVRGAAGALESLVLRTAADRVVRVERADTGWEARDEALTPVVETRTLAAEVATSVYEAVVDAGGSPELVLSFSDVFQWDLDFFADPRGGDRVVLLHEVLLRAAVPPATPRWREAADVAGEELGPGRILAAHYAGGKVQADGYWFDDPEGYYDGEGNSLRKTFLKSPLSYRRISSGFSKARRNPVTRKVVPHHGVDYAAATGTPVVASADGRVVSSGWKGSLGRHVRLRHGSGRYETVYGHFSRIAKGITPGTRVKQNQVIGYVGATGRATGPHLHFELHDRGKAMNPLTMDNPSTEPVPDSARPTFERVRDDYRSALQETLRAAPARATVVPR